MMNPRQPLEGHDRVFSGIKTRARRIPGWHQELTNAEYVFDFGTEIEEYYRSDVDILRRCCLQFKLLMEEVCNLDPFKHCLTIASACNRVFRQEFLEENTICLIPVQGYICSRLFFLLLI